MHEQWHNANNGNFQECTAHMQCQLGQITAHISAHIYSHNEQRDGVIVLNKKETKRNKKSIQLNCTERAISEIFAMYLPSYVSMRFLFTAYYLNPYNESLLNVWWCAWWSRNLRIFNLQFSKNGNFFVVSSLIIVKEKNFHTRFASQPFLLYYKILWPRSSFSQFCLHSFRITSFWQRWNSVHHFELLKGSAFSYQL